LRKYSKKLCDENVAKKIQMSSCFNPKKPGGGAICYGKACIPSIFIKTSQIVLVKDVYCHLSPKKFWEVDDDRGR
jgi:hypothetical protein